MPDTSGNHYVVISVEGDEIEVSSFDEKKAALEEAEFLTAGEDPVSEPSLIKVIKIDEKGIVTDLASTTVTRQVEEIGEEVKLPPKGQADWGWGKDGK